MKNLDHSNRADRIKSLIRSKPSLTKLYHEYYSRYVDCRSRSPAKGLSLEIGSGAGFLKDIIPEVITSDIVPYRTVDLMMDATEMPFPDCSISSVFMLNTLHHISRPTMLFNELTRCLLPGARVLIIDQYHGFISRNILKYIHHEPYRPDAREWDFNSSGPLSDANGALCWIIFFRDVVLFNNRYPTLSIVKAVPHTPLRYWLSGGLKPWNILPKYLFTAATKIDSWLSWKIPTSCSFVDLELTKNEIIK